MSADKCEFTWLRLFITNAALYCALARRHYRLESLTRHTLRAMHGTAALAAAGTVLILLPLPALPSWQVAAWAAACNGVAKLKVFYN